MNGYQVRIPIAIRNLETDKTFNDNIQLDFEAKDDAHARSVVNDIFEELFSFAERGMEDGRLRNAMGRGG